MILPLPFRDQYECRNETLEVYASDRRGLVEYQFNNLGYRNDIDYVDTQANAGVFLGSSITSGIGVDWSKSFVKLVSQNLAVEPYHFSQGCTKVDNREILNQISILKNNNFFSKFWVIQFIDLDRRFDPETGQTMHCRDTVQNVNEFVDIFLQIQSALANQTWCFFGCDGLSHAIPEYIRYHKNCLAWNPAFIDRAGVGDHPGVKWHQMMSLGIQKKLTKS